MPHGPADAPLSRRDLLKAAGAASAAIAVSSTESHATPTTPEAFEEFGRVIAESDLVREMLDTDR